MIKCEIFVHNSDRSLRLPYWSVPRYPASMKCTHIEITLHLANTFPEERPHWWVYMASWLTGLAGDGQAFWVNYSWCQ